MDFLLGDYDSVDKDVLDRYKSNTEFEIYPKEKDYTDTHLAIMTALKKGATQALSHSVPNGILKMVLYSHYIPLLPH